MHARRRGLDGRLRRLRVVARHKRDCIARLEDESGLRVPNPLLIPSDGPDLLARASTLHEMVACWHESERHSGSINSASAASMAGHIRNHIVETIGARRLDELNVYLLDPSCRAFRQR